MQTIKGVNLYITINTYHNYMKIQMYPESTLPNTLYTLDRNGQCSVCLHKILMYIKWLTVIINIRSHDHSFMDYEDINDNKLMYFPIKKQGTCACYCTIQNFEGRNFWQNSSQQRLVNNILANAQNRVDITKHSLVTHEIICHRDITCYIMCNVSWSPTWSTCLVLRQWFVAITNILEPVLNFVWAPRVLLVTIIRR